MFEGFDDGPWDYGDDLPPPENPEWWEVLCVIAGGGLLFFCLFKLFQHEL